MVLPGRGLDRTGATQLREHGFGANPVGVIAEEDQHLGRDAGADPEALTKHGRRLGREAHEVVWSKDSCGRSVVELQEAPETLAASHGPVLAHLLARKEEEVALPLVVPLAVEVFDVRAQRGL